VNLGTAFSDNQWTIIIQVADTGSAIQAPGQIYAVATGTGTFDVYSTGTVTPSSSADSGFCVFQWHIIGVTGADT
jgi:hypothetical protein